jgi:predicted nuclease of predicted toxin-antitoxin system
MKFLADENFPGLAVKQLRGIGFSVSWIAEDSPGAGDEAVMARCAAEQRTLLTLDKDFGELVFHRGLPAGCGIVLFRLDAQLPEEFARVATAVLKDSQEWAGNFAVVEPSRIRLRPVPVR